MKYLSKFNVREVFPIINIILNYIYPKNITCIICDNPIKITNSYSLCKDCFKELHFILDGCNKCGKPIINHNLERENLLECSYCYNKTFYFDRAISCIEYNEVSKKLILNLKYKNKTYLCKYIALIMKEKCDLEGIKFDYILFVPLHKKRLKNRGFNQSQKIANEFSILTGVEILDCIYRTKNTKKLYNLNKTQRQEELKNSFKINDSKGILKDKNIILIDDIFTTGTTVNEISKLLKLFGVNTIYILTLLTKSMDVYAKE